MLARRQSIRRHTPLARGGPLRRVSKRLAKERRIYGKSAGAFWAKPENQFCAVAASGVLGPPLERRATDRHHLDGRHGKKLNAPGNVIAVSRAGHDWIRDHANEARTKGWLV